MAWRLARHKAGSKLTTRTRRAGSGLLPRSSRAWAVRSVSSDGGPRAKTAEFGAVLFSLLLRRTIITPLRRRHFSASFAGKTPLFCIHCGIEERFNELSSDRVCL